MKQTVLVITNFTAASRNALSYACQFLAPNQYRFVLAHIYSLPLTYTVEGVALASVGEAFQELEAQLNGELEWVRQEFSQVEIRGHYILGGLVESSRELIATYAPVLLVFGTAGYYSALWHTDSELLLALRNLTVPVMIIPEHIGYHPLQRIGFACDYKNSCIPKQIDFIRNVVRQSGARLYVVHVTRSRPDSAVMKENEQRLREAVTDIAPAYHSIKNPEVFKAIDPFVREQKLELLIVIPRKHEFWQSLFHKNNIDQLAFLNRVPLLALPE